MTEFTTALLSGARNPNIPAPDDLFGPLVGAWDFEYINNHGTPHERHIAGEWFFSWVLEGTAIQDVFICPSRAERLKNPQPDAEYGTTLRIYNPTTGNWNVLYGCTGKAVQLEACKVDQSIVLTEITAGKMQWIFWEITENSFRWRNIERQNDGSIKLNCELLAKRK